MIFPSLQPTSIWIAAFCALLEEAFFVVFPPKLPIALLFVCYVPLAFTTITRL